MLDRLRPGLIDRIVAVTRELVAHPAGAALLTVPSSEDEAVIATAHPDVLRAASAGGRAASMFWNVNLVTRLSFAEAGRLLAEAHRQIGGGGPVAPGDHPLQGAEHPLGHQATDRPQRRQALRLAVARRPQPLTVTAEPRRVGLLRCGQPVQIAGRCGGNPLRQHRRGHGGENGQLGDGAQRATSGRFR